MTITEIFLFDFDAEMSRTRKLLELVPDPKSEWKPHEKSMKMGYLACHTAELANWCLGAAQTSQVDIPATFKREIPETIPQLLARFDTSVAEARAAIATCLWRIAKFGWVRWFLRC